MRPAVDLHRGWITWQSRRVNDDIRRGGFGSSFDITRRAVDGQIDNACAWTFGVGGAIALAVGVPIVVTTRIDDVRVHAASLRGPAVTVDG